MVENTVGKGEIARYEQFLLFPQCFQKTCTLDTQTPGLVSERVRQSTILKTLRTKRFLKSLVRKAGNVLKVFFSFSHKIVCLRGRSQMGSCYEFVSCKCF